MNQTFRNSPARILELASLSAPLGHALTAARKEDAFRRARFSDDLSLPSGWGHNFCCPDCAAEMIFEYDRPTEYVCSHCGRKTAPTQLLDEAWAFYKRYYAGLALSSSALCYLVDGNRESLDYIIRYVDFYAGHYAALPPHGRNVGKGKVMSQSLDEAVWAFWLLNALNICGRDTFPPEKRAYWMDFLFRPMAEFLMPQGEYIHNIPMWLWCAVGAIAVFFEDDALLAHALENEFGIRNQVQKGFTADGLWYECSMGYHYYSARALAQFLCFYAQKQPQDELFNALRRAFEVPAELSPDGEHLPAVNDGWYPLSVDNEQLAVLRASRIIDSPVLAGQLGGIFSRRPERFEKADALLYLRDVPAASKLPQYGAATAYPATALGVLHQPAHVLMKCGVLTLSHMHDDCMSITLPPFSDDLGTPGYGHPLTDRYYRRTIAHNSFMMDGQSQPHRTVFGQVETISSGIRGHADEIYDGVSCTRTVTGEGHAVMDEMVIQARESHTFDWVFRAAGRCTMPEGDVSAVLPYDVLTDVRRYPNVYAFALFFELEGRKLTVRIDPETLKNAEVYTARIPGNPADQLQTAVLLRSHGAQVQFRANYEQA